MFLSVCLALGCAASQPTSPPDVLWIVLDAAAASECGDRAETPHLQQFAKEALVFERAYAQGPQTTLSVASFLTGRYPPSAWVDRRLRGPTVVEYLRETGYTTVAFSENPWVSESFGFERGFSEFTVGAAPSVAGFDADQTLRDAAALILEDREGPILTYVHLLPPHSPYRPPAPFRADHAPRDLPPGPQAGFMKVALGDEKPTREDYQDHATVFWGKAHLSEGDLEYLHVRYLENLAFADARVGAFLGVLDQQNALDDTLVIVTSDHGEAFGQHGHVLHSTSLYDEQIRVPLIIREPMRYRRPPQVAREVVQLVDLAPTLLRLAGLPVPDAMEGRDLLERRGPTPALSFMRGGTQAVVSGRLKLIRSEEQDLLFDLVADPEELEDLSASMSREVERLSAIAESRRAHPGEAGTAITADPEVQEQLRALGYLLDGP